MVAKSEPLSAHSLTSTLLQQQQQQEPSLAYYLSMEEPQTHYYEVEMHVSKLDRQQDTLEVHLPVWTPGSYMVREFSRKVEGFVALTTDGKTLQTHKNRKNSWVVALKNNTDIVIRYRVYSFEFSVRTSFLDADHATINPSSVFMYIAQYPQLPATLHIKPYKDWKKISTSLSPLTPKDPWTLHIPNYDILVDSPIEIGNHETYDFEAAGIPHQLAIIGPGNHDVDRMIADIKKIAATEADMFKEHPCKRYVVLQYNTDGIYGGLEHLNSTALAFPRWDYTTKHGKWQGLMSHEYFHLWNVKRIRPIELGPFDYDNENYTNLLWVMEGVTSYYDDLILRRAGLLGIDAYLGIVAANITDLENKPGNIVQPVAESSWDAWIKYYRSDENSDNATISYYMKGAVLATMLNLEILQLTKGEKGLDDVMRLLYNDYYKQQQRGFTDAEMQSALETTAGQSLQWFYDKHINAAEPVSYQRFFDYVGLTLEKNHASAGKLSLGITTKTDNSKFLIAKTLKGSAGYKAGLNVNDEILAIDNYRVNSDANIETLLASCKSGQNITVLVNRGGILRSIPVVLENDKSITYKLVPVENPSEQQTLLFKKWLQIE